MNNPDRRRANRRGRHAETVAAGLLRLKGYRILARGYRTPVGEIDVIATRGRVVAFIEVKARDNLDTALAAVGPKQRIRIQRAAEQFMAMHAGLQGHDLRFDVVAVVPGKLPRHVVDAWRP
ncbi:MAG: YraN family protein [Rhodospirillales bacterium]|nr:YraN family protein [Rhodospirillales bacterium]MBO6787594.1 YraN family protein [Rhodospirillales bacterium]